MSKETDITEIDIDIDINSEKKVRTQYEDYPYPPRKDDEVVHTHGDTLEIMNHFCFNADSTFENFRVLVAGCGTGDSTTWLGIQLSEMGVKHEIIGLDISKTNLEIAKKRATNNGVTDIKWIHDSLLNLPEMKDIGKFDYIIKYLIYFIWPLTIRLYSSHTK